MKPTENYFSVGKQGDTQEDCYYHEDAHHYIAVPKEWTEGQTEEFINQTLQDQKLRELFENYVQEVEEMNNNPDDRVAYAPTLFKLQEILKESKK